MTSPRASRVRKGVGVRRGAGGAVRLALLAVGLAALAAPAGAATVQGAFRYAGLPVAATFPNLKSWVAYCYSYDKKAANTYLLDGSGGSYSLPVDLAPGQYLIHFLLSRAPGRQDIHPKMGELFGAAMVTLTSFPTYVADIDLSIRAHLLAPVDSQLAWQGTSTECPRGPETPATFSVTWESVPRAVGYSVHVQRWDCSHLLAEEILAATSTSIAVTHHRQAGEQYLAVEVYARDADGRTITFAPSALYSDGWGPMAFHAAEGVARPVHEAGARFIYQAGHKQGLLGTFWRTDLVLTNPTSGPIVATLYFTPRDANGITSFTAAEVEVPAHASRGFTDVVDTLFHATGFGNIEVVPGSVELQSRTYTAGPNPPGGAYGQGLPAVAADATAFLDGDSALLGGGFVIKGAYRTNLSLIEVWGEPARVAVRLADREGEALGAGTLEYDVPPLGSIQLNDLGLVFGVESVAEAHVTVEVLSGAGRVAGCLSVVDNGSQDPSTLPLVRRFL